MTFDIEKYRHHVDHFDLSEPEKKDIIHIVRRIMESFVDRAFGHDPVQTVLHQRNVKSAFSESSVVKSKTPGCADLGNGLLQIDAEPRGKSTSEREEK